MGARALLLLLACGVALTAKPTRPKSVTAACTNSSGDCTLELQAALDTGAETVRIPHIGRPWILSMAGNPGGAALRARAGGYHGAAISLRSHQQVVLESGVVLQAARGSFHGEQDSLLMGASVENVSIIGEPPLGATLQMWLLDYANKSLYTEGTCSGRGACRMGVSLMNVSGLEMRRLTVRRSGGDGVFVRGVYGGLFKDLVLDDNFRQGISLTDGRDLLFEDVAMINTGQGAAAGPSCGLDIEPDNPANRLQNITFRRCQALNNTACGFTISPHGLGTQPIE